MLRMKSMCERIEESFGIIARIRKSKATSVCLQVVGFLQESSLVESWNGSKATKLYH